MVKKKAKTVKKVKKKAKKVIELSDLHKRFCEEFIMDLKPTKAYMRVYPDSSYNAAKSSASGLLTKGNIITRIALLMEERSERVKVDVDNILDSILEIRERCMQSTPVLQYDHGTRRMEETGEYEFKESGALKANELIGRHLAMFTDKSKIEHSLGEGMAERITRAKEKLKKNKDDQ